MDTSHFYSLTFYSLCTPGTGARIMCVQEWSNKDLFANVLKKSTKTFGHVPHTMSCFDLFALPALGCNLSLRSYRKGKTQTVEVSIRLIIAFLCMTSSFWAITKQIIFPFCGPSFHGRLFICTISHIIGVVGSSEA